MYIRICIVSCVSRGVLQVRYNAHIIDPSEWLKAIHIKLSVCLNGVPFLSHALPSHSLSIYLCFQHFAFNVYMYKPASTILGFKYYGWAIRWKWFLKRIFENRFKCHMFFGSSCGRKKTCGAENCLGVC